MPAGVSAVDSGSFRDPSGVVLIAEGRVFRTIEQCAWDDFDAVQSSGILSELASAGRVVGTWPVEREDVPSGLTDGLPTQPRRLVEHEVIPFISYPYEWPFSLLRRAALHYLDLHLDLLERNFTLSDASAYNIQFRGTRPVFIDVLSIRPYREGEYWTGYRQFCEQFLNPLLLVAVSGIPYQAWFRGNIEGIPVEHAARILPPRARLSWRMLLHVFLHARMIDKSRRYDCRATVAATGAVRTPMSKAALMRQLKSLRAWIAGLAPRGTTDTRWIAYADDSSYTPDEAATKRAFVSHYVEQQRPTELVDMGCHSGSYSQLALSTGATKRVIGFDSDAGALEAAVARADEQELDLLPLFLDAVNPSPDQGWAQRERRGLRDRVKAEGLLALAFLHHLVIGRNVPLAQALKWLVGVAPSGVIEFVPKKDKRVQQMLMHRLDIFPTYHIDVFREELARRARIVGERAVSASGRTLFEYRR